MRFLRLLRQLWPAILLFLVLYVVTVLVLRQVGLEQVRTWVEGVGIWAPIVFVAIGAVSLIIAPLSGSSTFIIGGAIFGKEIGWLLSLIASIIGCSINYWISKKLGRRVVIRLIGKDSLDELDLFISGLRSHHSIIYMMLIMLLAQDVVSYAVGLTSIKYIPFSIALVISGAVLISAYIYLGTGLLEAILE